MKESGLEIKKMDKVFKFGPTDQSTLGSGSTIYLKAKANSSNQTVTLYKDPF